MSQVGNSTKTAKPSITQTMPYDSPGTLIVFYAKDLGEIRAVSPPTTVLNADVVF